ncbi:hypothetical protein EDD16DRAFT_1516338 [Pisolithus croceorrhizus]|nr:hypothetical protein EDD16DRAFT_1516338 [Pisolithus croceorrhizus]
MVESQEANHVHRLAQKALEANREHQRALNTYIERLEAELQMVERLIDAANIEVEDDSDLDVPGFVLVPGAVRARARFPPRIAISMKARELDALAEAVRTENYRKMAFDAQILVSMTTRTAKECEIRWLGDRHPDFNHDPWKEEEIARLKSLVAGIEMARRIGRT